MSTEFRPLSTRALCALELHDLNPVDTSWSAFNYYLYPSWQGYISYLYNRFIFLLAGIYLILIQQVLYPSWQGYISYVLLDSSCLLCVFLRYRHLYLHVEVVVVVCVCVLSKGQRFQIKKHLYHAPHRARFNRTTTCTTVPPCHMCL